MNRRKCDFKLPSPNMTSYKVVADLLKKEFSTVHSDIKILVSSDQKCDCFDVCNVLKAIYQAVVPSSSVETLTEDAKKLVLDLVPSIKLCIDFAHNGFSCSDLVEHDFINVLYHFIRTFLKVELYETALMYGRVIKHLLEDPTCNFDRKNSYIKNVAGLFWNGASPTGVTLDPGTAMALRELCVEFLLVNEECVDDQTSKRIGDAVNAYLKSGNVDESRLRSFLLSMWSRLERLGVDPGHRAFLFRALQLWCDVLLKNRRDRSSMLRHFLSCFQDLSRKCTKEEKVLSTCCDLSRLCLQFFSLQETGLRVKKAYLNYGQFFKNREEWSRTDAQTVGSTAELILSCLQAHYVKFVKNLDNGGYVSYLQSNVLLYRTFISYFVVSYEEKIESNLAAYLKNVFSAFNIFNSSLLALLKDEQNDAKIKLFLSEAKFFVNFSYSKIMNLPQTDAVHRFIMEYITRVRNLAFVLYQKKLYPDSIYFFEINEKLLSRCKSLPEYDTEETQKTLWKSLEYFVYACFLCGKYEEALPLIVGALTDHPKKTRECLDLWRKVKKEAVRKQCNTVASKIISDVLQEMGAEIEPDKEIVYLIEEFKICKSERSDFEEELLAVCQRLLSMPLSNFDRAYLCLGSLTALTDVSEKLSALLKKPLSEICQEVIALLTDHVAKNPQDYPGKLYLSIAYFWNYENNLKGVYEIAEKEAQNILRPPSPKPDARIQNDVEEENDTCDIQPVHPLVSLSVERECLKHLNLAVELWEGIPKAEWQNMSATVKVENVCDMIQATAETFCTAVHDLKELKLWILLRSVSTAVDSRTHRLASCSSLANLLTKLGYLNMSACILGDVRGNDCFGSESDIERAMFKLAEANYFLHTEKFDDGLDILRDIQKSSVISLSQKSAKMLRVETMLLSSEFLSLPTKAFSRPENIEFLVESSPLAFLTEAAVTCKSIMKHLAQKQPIFSNRYDWLHFKVVVIKDLLKSHVRLGDLYFKSGEPRYARCILQDSLKVAESHILTYWSSKILLILGQIDLVCDNFKDCHVKASGLKYIFDESSNPNCLEFLMSGQNKSDTSSSVSASPDSPNELVMPAIPDITLARHIKQEFIDKIDVMSSPLSKKHLKNKSDQLFQYHFDEENFSMSILKLETFLLFYVLSKSELDSKKSLETIQVLSNHCSQFKNLKCLPNTLKLLNVSFKVEEPFSRLQTKGEISLNHSIQVQKIELYCIKNDISSAKKTVKKSIDFFERASVRPGHSYPDMFALLKYHDVRITLCEFYEIPLSCSFAHYICPSVKPYVRSKKKSPVEKSEHLPNTPVNKKMPDTVISKHKPQSKKCGAPLKKNLLNSNLKKDLESEKFPETSPFIICSSSDEETNFESPFNSLSRASRTRSGPKKVSKRSDKSNLAGSYKFFKQKNGAVKDASDIWNLCLTDTPKLGKENRRLRSANSKRSETSKRKIQLTHHSDSSQQVKPSRTGRSRGTKTSDSPPVNSVSDLAKDIEGAFSSISERKSSIENSRSSPFDRNNATDSLPGNSNSDALNRDFSDDLMCDNVFLTPLQNTRKAKVANLIDNLCNDLSSLSLGKSKSTHIIAGNLDEILSELNELRLLLQNAMPYPLYTDICKLLGVLLLVKRNGNCNDEKLLRSSFLMSEAFSVSLRSYYVGSVLYYREPEFLKERDLVIDTIKRPYGNIDLQMESFLSAIPDNWSVVQVSAFFSQEYLATSGSSPFPTKFLMTQYQKNAKPIIVSTDCSPRDERFSADLLTELEKIIAENAVTMLNKDCKSWWATRSALDVRLKNLMRDVENVWLGCWKGLFLGLPREGERIKHLVSAVDAITKTAPPCQNEELLQILVDSAEHLTNEQVCTAVCYLWNCGHTSDVHVKLCRNIRQISTALPATERHPLILILDQCLLDVPWESMPIAKGVPISRMPSLSFLHMKLRTLASESVLSRGFDSSRTYYVLNPACDLIHTQEYFEEQFKRQKTWNGVIGRAPDVKDYISGYKDHELFLYCGHGSGKKYFEGTSVDKLVLQSTSVLMGCSSGKLKRLGRVFEAGGIVLKLLLRGCPSVAANLWDVTDRDIDRFTEKLFQYLIPNYDDVPGTTYDVAKACALARSACKLGYLVGAAPVVYGLPVFATPK